MLELTIIRRRETREATLTIRYSHHSEDSLLASKRTITRGNQSPVRARGRDVPAPPSPGRPALSLIPALTLGYADIMPKLPGDLRGQ